MSNQFTIKQWGDWANHVSNKDLTIARDERLLEDLLEGCESFNEYSELVNEICDMEHEETELREYWDEYVEANK